MLNDLTDAQKARFGEFVDKWTAVGLSTEPADRPRAEAGIKLAYKLAGLKEPAIVWCDSPRAILYAAVNDDLNPKPLTKKQATSHVPKTSEFDQVKNNLCYGQHDAGWLSFYDFFRTACGLEKETEKLMGLFEIAYSAGWFCPTEDVCWVCERPTELYRDEQGRLHNPMGAAVAYPDGCKLYFYNGVEVPAYWVEEPERINPSIINKQSNTELRRIAIEIYGADKYLKVADAKLIQEDKFGKLYHLNVDDEELAIVEVINSTPEPDGTYDHHCLFVPTDLPTAHAAVAWTFYQTPETYVPAVET